MFPGRPTWSPVGPRKPFATARRRSIGRKESCLPAHRKTRTTCPTGSIVSAAARHRMQAWTLATARQSPHTWRILPIGRSGASRLRKPRPPCHRAKKMGEKVGSRGASLQFPVSSLFANQHSRSRDHDCSQPPPRIRTGGFPASGSCLRSEEHTSELQSLAYLVCRLLLEKKKNKKYPPLSFPQPLHLVFIVAA